VAFLSLPLPSLLPPIYLPSVSGADFAIINRARTYMAYFPALFLSDVAARSSDSCAHQVRVPDPRPSLPLALCDHYRDSFVPGFEKISRAYFTLFIV